VLKMAGSVAETRDADEKRVALRRWPAGPRLVPQLRAEQSTPEEVLMNALGPTCPQNQHGPAQVSAVYVASSMLTPEQQEFESNEWVAPLRCRIIEMHVDTKLAFSIGAPGSIEFYTAVLQKRRRPAAQSARRGIRTNDRGHHSGSPSRRAAQLHP
jgi:hypothetical protein